MRLASSVASSSDTKGDVPPRISVSFRPILGATEELAWERAHRILEAGGTRGRLVLEF